MLVVVLGSCDAVYAEGPIAQDLNNKGQLIQTIKLIRNNAGTLANRCDTVLAAGTVVYSVANTSAISYTVTDATYVGVTVKRSWDSDTAYMPIFASLTEVPGTGVKTVTITNVTAASAIVCIERQVNGDSTP
jgi:hypothetical protein